MQRSFKKNYKKRKKEEKEKKTRLVRWALAKSPTGLKSENLQPKHSTPFQSIWEAWGNEMDTKNPFSMYTPRCSKIGKILLCKWSSPTNEQEMLAETLYKPLLCFTETHCVTVQRLPQGSSSQRDQCTLCEVRVILMAWCGCCRWKISFLHQSWSPCEKPDDHTVCNKQSWIHSKCSDCSLKNVFGKAARTLVWDSYFEINESMKNLKIALDRPYESQADPVQSLSEWEGMGCDGCDSIPIFKVKWSGKSPKISRSDLTALLCSPAGKCRITRN